MRRARVGWQQYNVEGSDDSPSLLVFVNKCIGVLLLYEGRHVVREVPLKSERCFEVKLNVPTLKGRKKDDDEQES